jgi:hypothetical protein
VQIADAKLFDNKTERYEYLIPPETVEKIVALLRDDPRVKGYTWTLGFAGLIGNEKGSTLVVAGAGSSLAIPSKITARLSWPDGP